MTLNGILALILRYFTEFDSYQLADYITVVEGGTIISTKYCLPVTFGQNLPTQ